MPSMSSSGLGAITALRFAPDSRWIVSAGADGRVLVYDARNGALLEILDGHAGYM